MSMRSLIQIRFVHMHIHHDRGVDTHPQRAEEGPQIPLVFVNCRTTVIVSVLIPIHGKDDEGSKDLRNIDAANDVYSSAGVRHFVQTSVYYGRILSIRTHLCIEISEARKL